MEDRIERGFRRHKLALRMISHRARRRTICNFTGLTRERIKTIRREWHVSSKDCRRGPSPTSLIVFFRSPRIRSEASVIAFFCRILGAVPNEKIPNAARYYPTLERGERLCEAYEAFSTYFPDTKVNFELIVLLAISLAEPHALELKSCRNCRKAIITLDEQRSRFMCEQCDKPSFQGLRRTALSKT